MPWPAWDFTGLGAVGADVDSPPRQPEVGGMENVSFGRDFGTVTAFYVF